MMRPTERMDLLVSMFQDIREDIAAVRQEIVVVREKLAGYGAQIVVLERADGEHDKAHARHRAEHRSSMLKILLAALGTIPAVVGAAWWLARKLP